MFQLVRIALDTDADYMFHSDIDWKGLMDYSHEQGISAIVLDGLQRVFDLYENEDRTHSIAVTLPCIGECIYDWFGVSMSLEQSNLHQRQVLVQMAKNWEEVGLGTILLKGQANSLYYPEPLHRNTGDIDVYLIDMRKNQPDTAYECGNRVATEIGAKVDTHWYKHSQIHWKGEMFENHQYFVHTRDGKRGKKLDATLRALLEDVEFEKFPGSEVLLPPVMFNALFLTYHGLAHFVSEGIRLKQILDWALFLKKEQARIDWPRLYALCEEFHLRRWLDAMNDIAVHQFGVEVNVSGVVCDSPFAEKILHSAFYDNDYVFNSGKSGWANRWHLVTNMFKYSWKYHKIYQESVLRQLWFYATGFLFKTE